MLRRLAIGPALLVLWSLAPTASAALPEVQVVFKLADQNCIDGFEPAEIGQIESRCGVRLREALAKRLSFLTYVTTPRLDRLVVTLGQPGSRGIGEVDFVLELAGPGIVRETSEVRWVYRDAQESLNSPGNSDDFIKDVEDRFAKQLKKRYSELVDNLFSKLLLTSHAHPMLGAGGWALPFTRDELPIDFESNLVVHVEMVVDNVSTEPSLLVAARGTVSPGATDCPVDCKNEILAEIVDAEARSRMRAATRLIAKEVFLTKYIPLSKAGAVEITADIPAEELNP